MSDLIAEGLILVKSWSGELDAPVPELRMIEKLTQELEQIQEISERRADLLLKAEAKIGKLDARCDRDDELIFQMKDEISKLKSKNNSLDQKLKMSRKKIQSARSWLDSAFYSHDMDYDIQGVNQAHRVLDGGQPPKKTKLEK